MTDSNVKEFKAAWDLNRKLSAQERQDVLGRNQALASILGEKEETGVLGQIRDLIHERMEQYHSEEFGDKLDRDFGSASSGDAGWTSATYLEEEIVAKVLDLVQEALK